MSPYFNFFNSFIKVCVLTNTVAFVLSSNNHPRQLEKIGGDEVFRREMDDSRDIYQESTKSPKHYNSGTLDPIGGGNILRMFPPGEGQLVRSALNNLATNEYLASMENNRADLLDILNKLSNGELSRSLDNVDPSDFLVTLEDTMREEKRGMDSLMGETFGLMKRYKPMMALAKRNFDEIDNVGFNNWVKKSSTKDKKGPRMHSLALARRDFGNSRRYHVNSLAKRNFDEIDRTGFEGFSKRQSA